LSSKKKGVDSKEELHCVRCHNVFIPGNNNACIIEHDTETFEGSRNGTSWYTGKLGCCGAAYEFHRHDSREKADPKYCFQGSHTTDPDEVKYNKSSILICSVDRCGKELHDITKETYNRQKDAKKRAREEKKKKRSEDETSKKARIKELTSEGKTREARQLRASMLGLDSNDDALDSDVDPDGCEEFDYASDSSLVPPWLAGGGSSGGDY